MGGSYSEWTITIADLSPPGAPVDGERLAMAVVTLKAFPRGAAVTDSMVHEYATSISTELRYRLIQAGGRP